MDSFDDGWNVTQEELHQNPFASLLPQDFAYDSHSHGAHYPSEHGYYGQGPIVHEGFIPTEEDIQYDEDPTNNSPSDFQFSREYSQYSSPAYFESSHADNEVDGDEAMDEEEDVLMNEELVLNSEMPETNDPSLDPDYSMSDGDINPDETSDQGLDSDFESEREGRRGSARGRVKGRGRGKARGEGRGRGRSRGRGRGRPRGSGEGKAQGAPRGKRGPREPKDPGPEFKRTLAQATQAWLNEELDPALQYAGEAIKINPEVFAAYNLLSEILYAKGQYEESVHALSMGALLQRDVRLWHQIAGRVLELEGDERERLEWAHRCYSQIIRIDANNWEARCRRLDFQLRFNHKGQAKAELEMMLKIEGHEHDLDRLQQLAELCAVTQEPERAVTPFERAIRHHIQSSPNEYSQLDWQILNSYLELMQTLRRYREAIPLLKAGARWILGRQNESFWDSQPDDREWDMQDEPRRDQVDEFIPGRYGAETYGAGLPLEIRVKLGMFRLGLGPEHRNEALAHFEHLEPENESEAANVFDFDDLFREVADALTVSGNHMQALRYYKALRKVPEVPQTALCISIAACHWALQRPEEAERSIAEALEVAGTNLSARVQVARFFQDWGMTKRCADVAQDVIARGGLDLVRRAKLNVQLPPGQKSAEAIAKKPLVPKPPKPSKPAVVRELARKPTTLQSLEPKKPRTRPREPKDPNEPKEKKRRLRGLLDTEREKLEEAQLRDKAIRELYQELKSLQDAVDTGDEEATSAYMDAASEMVDEFRRMEAFYPRNDKTLKFTGYVGRISKTQSAMRESTLAYLATLSNRVGTAEADPESQLYNDEKAPEDFHDIPFDEWLEIFCQYALLLAKRGINGRCWVVIQAAAGANIFHHDAKREYHIHVCWLACALILRDEEHLSNACRYLIKQHPYANDAYRLYGMINRLYVGHRSWYNGGPSQKFVLRLIKAMDFALLDTEGRRLYKFGDQERSGYTRGGLHDGNPEGLTELNVALLVMYAHVLATGGSDLNALNYYFRAYSLAPDDPIINFSIAMSYIQHAMKRQSENRQYQIQQGLAFLYRYYQIRTKDNIAILIQEAEFNVARMWHTLGLTHLALPAYEKVMALREHVHHEENEDDFTRMEDFSAEAAFAIQTILALSEEFEGARRLTEKWLVI